MSQGELTSTVNTVQNMRKIPRAVRRAATARGLGMPEAIYLPKDLTLLYVLAGSLLIAIGALIIFAFSYFFTTIFSWWPRWQSLSIPVLGLGWIAVGLWIFLSPLLSPVPRVFVFSNGFVWVKRKAEAVPWDWMEKVWKKVEPNKRGAMVRSYIVRTSNDAMYLFNEPLPHIEQLGARLEQELVSRCLPPAITLYTTGVPLIFGEIILSVQGLGVKRGRKILPWKEIEKIVIDDSYISVYAYASARGARAPSIQPIAHVARIPNVEVLRGLIEYIKEAWRPVQSPLLIAYNSGTRVFFGALSISVEGVELHAQKKFLPWSDIASVSVGEHDVLIRKHSHDWEWYTIPTWAISDIEEFKFLIEQVVLKAEQ